MKQRESLAMTMREEQRMAIDDYPECDTDEELEDPRCDFEKDPSLADGWFFRKY